MTEKKRPPVPGGDLELALLTALWGREGEKATARELYEEVGQSRGLVYTTVAKVLDRLVGKRMVGRRRAGRAYAYFARIKQADTQRAIARNLIGQLTGAEPRPAAAALLGALEDVSPALLAELTAELQGRRGRNDGA